LFSISKQDLQRLRGIQLAYVREMQAVIAESEPGECVALYCAQLLDLGRADDNAFSHVLESSGHAKASGAADKTRDKIPIRPVRRRQ
jgi:hypothetical protein